MKKKLFTLIFLIVFLVVGSKAFIALFSYQVIESIKQGHQHNLALTYAWISSGFDGKITIHDVVITPYALKRTIYLEEITFEYGNYLDLLLNLPLLKDVDIRGIKALRVPSIRIPLKGRDVDEWLAMEFGVKSIHSKI